MISSASRCEAQGGFPMDNNNQAILIEDSNLKPPAVRPAADHHATRVGYKGFFIIELVISFKVYVNGIIRLISSNPRGSARMYLALSPC